MGMLMMFSSMGGGNSSQVHFLQLLEGAAVSFTKGETTNVQGTKFLITYKVSTPISSVQGLTEGHAVPEMELVLVRMDTIRALAPKPDFDKNKLLALFGPPNPNEPAQVSARKTSTLSNLKQTGTAMMIYLADNDDEIPYVQDTKSAFAVLQPYTKNTSVYRSLNPGSEFRMNMAVAGVNQAAIEEPASTPMFYETQTWPDGTRGVVFCDSHAKMVSPDEWNNLQKYLTLKLKRNSKPLPPNYWRQLHFDFDPQASPGSITPTAAPPPKLVK